MSLAKIAFMVRSWMLFGVCVGAISLFNGVVRATESEPKLPVKPSDVDGNSQPFLITNRDVPTAPVRSVLFAGDRLISAGLDKVVRTWTFSEQTGIAKGDIYRWPIEHGILGVIYAVAVSPDQQRIAFGGVGYSGGVGDLVQLDLVTGKIVAMETRREALPADKQLATASRSPIASLCYTSDGKWLVSRELKGKVWIRPADASDTPPRLLVSTASQNALDFAPLGVAGDRVIVSEPMEPTSNGDQVWRLQAYAIDGQTEPQVMSLKGKMVGGVTGIACAGKGTAIVATDLANTGRVLYWPSMDAEPQAIDLRSTPGVSVGLNEEGTRMIVGTYADQNEAGSIQLYELPARSLHHRQSVSQPTWACSLSSSGKSFAYVQGNSLRVGSFDEPTRQADTSGGSIVRQVEFDPGENPYRVRMLLTTDGTNEKKQRRFDLKTQTMEIDNQPLNNVRRNRFGNWQAEIVSAKETKVLRISHPSFPSRDVSLVRSLHGNAVTLCWIPGSNQEPLGIAVGLEASEFSILVVDHLTGDIARAFRGHQGATLSVDASKDGRYLVSGSIDGTLRYWSLESLREPRRMRKRWGMEFELAKDLLRVTEILDPGPLYDKGIRAGDVLKSIRYQEPDGRIVQSDSGDTIYRALQNAPWHTQILFEFERNGQPIPSLQMVGWHDFLAVFVADPNWIAWTPVGYYACSLGGERLIGWQVNDRVGEPPAIYEAINFYKALHRPEAISKLLMTGRLSQALVTVKTEPAPALPPPIEEPKPIRELLPPTVQMLEPLGPTVTIKNNTLSVRATAAAAANAPPVTKLRLLIGGSSDPQYEIDVSQQRSIEHTWSVKLDPGEHDISVIAESDSGVSKPTHFKVVYQPEMEQRRLFVLAIGISDYLPPHQLGFAAHDARRVAEAFEHNSRGLYDRVEVKFVENRKATKEGIREGLQWLSSQMAQRDVGVLFFAGHGTSQDNQFYLVPVEGDNEDIKNTCLNESELKSFCKQIGGRGKLFMLLDACHSGAMEINRFALDLNRPEFNITAMVSCLSHEKSYEDAVWNGGAFSRALSDGLLGKADYPIFPDGKIDSVELFAYVHYAVQEMVKSQGYSQTPMADLNNQTPYALTKVAR